MLAESGGAVGFAALSARFRAPRSLSAGGEIALPVESSKIAHGTSTRNVWPGLGVLSWIMTCEVTGSSLPLIDGCFWILPHSHQSVLAPRLTPNCQSWSGS